MPIYMCSTALCPVWGVFKAGVSLKQWTEYQIPNTKIWSIAWLFLLKWQCHLYLHILMSLFLWIFLANHRMNDSEWNLQSWLFKNPVQNLMVTQIILHAEQHKTLVSNNLPLAFICKVCTIFKVIPCYWACTRGKDLVFTGLVQSGFWHPNGATGNCNWSRPTPDIVGPVYFSLWT